MGWKCWRIPTDYGRIISHLLSNAAKFSEKGGSVWLASARVGGDTMCR
jgi:signal transduction histidine kinase